MENKMNFYKTNKLRPSVAFHIRIQLNPFFHSFAAVIAPGMYSLIGHYVGEQSNIKFT